MTGFNSISDLARSYQLRVSQSSLKAKLATLTEENTTGVKADIPRALNGDLQAITQIEARISQLATYATNITQAETRLTGMQSALESIRSQAADGVTLMSEALVSSDAALRLQIDKAPEQLRSVIGALNTSVGGRQVFSGTRTDRPAVVGYDTMMGQITAAVGGATAADTILARIDAYFDGAAEDGGYLDAAFQGDTGATLVAVDAQKTLRSDVTAGSAEIRAALKGFAVMAYLAEQDGLDSQTARALTEAAGKRMTTAEGGLISAAATLGVQEEHAAKLRTANSAESSALSTARNTLVLVDPYEAATALKEVEANLETLYTVTSRLSKLSLMSYL